MRPTTPPPQSPAPSAPTTPQQALISVSQVPVPASVWRPILEASGQLVLYNPTSHALSITQHSLPPSNPSRSHDHASQRCPYCSQVLPTDVRLFSRNRGEEDPLHDGRRPTRRAPNYFQLLELANMEGTPRPSSPPQLPQNGEAPPSEEAPTGFLKGSMAQGYFSAFFREERRIGMGANGTVFLCQHLLDGNDLGYFAVKKVAVGHSHDYLLRILREVKLLEKLRHPNIITYHHSWLETTQFSSFGPPIPTLHVLMEWAELGSLEDLIDSRLGKAVPVLQNTLSVSDADEISGAQTRSSRIRAFRKSQRAAQGLSVQDHHSPLRTETNSAIHFLSGEEIRRLLADIVSGLAFLHDRSVLHLDLKLGNVLLTKDDDELIPRAMLSDFGTSQDMLQVPRVRSGNTGTVEYSAPEALARDPSGSLLQMDSKSDMWSLGVILHKLIFLRSPYPEIDSTDVDGMERNVLAYEGYNATPQVIWQCKRRGLPRALLLLLENLLHINSKIRPSADRVLNAIREGKFEPYHVSHSPDADRHSLVRRQSAESDTPISVDPPAGSESVLSSSPPSPILALPSSEPPSPPLPKARLTLRPNTQIPQSILSLSRFVLTRRLPEQRHLVSLFKAALLVAKVVSINRVCWPDIPGTTLQAGLVGLGVLDLIQPEELRSDRTAALFLAHLVALVVLKLWRNEFCAI